MALVPGTRVGPYAVVAPLGAGGMGEVYRARDTRLDRDVALKFLPEHLAHDSERLARFEREAKTLAALNHPHIAQIHGVEDSSSTHALVMELVEGPTLADRIAQGPIPLDEALPIARQIAEALEAAHDLGIVHRDLKPANVKVRPDGTVKVLDFGLAKAVGGDSGAIAVDTVTDSPTITTPAMTGRGVILGTAAYMSPEQAKGKPVDRRADIWAFGCVLFEMLTGRRTFEGEDVSDTLASVLRAEPPWSVLPATVPPRVRLLLERCLERDMRKRLPHIGVARLELAEGQEAAATVTPVTPPVAAGASWRIHAGWAAAAAAALAGGIALNSREPAGGAAPRPGVRFEIRPPDGQYFPGANTVPRFAVSPDGSAAVFASSVPGQRDQLYLRRFDELEPQPISGTETTANAGDAQQQPFFSPDGRFVAFFSGVESTLKRVPVSGGQVERLAALPAQNCSGDWRGAVILVACSGTRGIQRLAASGGALTAVTSLDGSRGEIAHLWPQFLPDGEHFIYLALAEGEVAATYVGSLTGGPLTRLVETPAMPRFAPPDRLLFVRGDALMSQAVDMKTYSLMGEPIMAQDGVMMAANTRVGVSTSDSGVLVIAEGTSGEGIFQAIRRNRRGERIEPAVVASNLLMAYVRLSPDGRFVAFERSAQFGDVWIKDLVRGVESRVSAANLGTNRLPVWSHDSRRLVYQSNRDAGSRTALYVRDIAALQPETRLLVSDGEILPDDWSPAGDVLLLRELVRATTNLLVLRADGSGELTPFRRDGTMNRQAAFSPDGQWVAYASNEAGPRQQVFVRAFPDPSVAKIQVSGSGGGQPRWRRDARELFYIDAESRLVAVPATGGRDGSVEFGTPVVLFPLDTPTISGAGPLGAVYDVAPDGQSFITVERVTSARPTSLTVTVDWMSELRP